MQKKRIFLEYIIYLVCLHCFNDLLTELQQCICCTSAIHKFLSQEILLM